ncbi:hypothetical protein H5410_002396 [Solanum commersonii]|uniref:Uncharacterized protein n=1 Tax=Solanum commersonii TaxID=4109 RepID=A0A9J6B2Q9_SOLCO|nr:hypothetical protein H5410_002396 [Solanum commersonii]
MEPTTVTLWGDFAENDGAFLDKLKDDKSILSSCDVRVSIYKGIFGISTIPVSSILINLIFPKCNRPTSLVRYLIHKFVQHEIIEADNKDITVAPTKAMKRAIEVLLDHILNGLFAESQDSIYKFKATIVDIRNKDEPWYLSRKMCRKKVKVIEEAATCTNCNIDNIDYAMRYCLRLEVCSGEKDANPRKSLIAEEIHQLEDEAPIILEEEVRSVRKYRKRAKKTTNAMAQINHKKPKAAKD